MRRGIGGLALVVLLALAGCNAAGTLQVTSQQRPPLLPAHPTLRLVVQPVIDDATPLLPDLRVALMSQLLAHGPYARVLPYDGPADLLLTVDVATVAQVTPGERVLLGGLAGRNRVAATCRLIDPASGVIVKSFDAEGISAALPLSDEAGISDAIRQLARQVAEGAAL